MIIHVVLIDPAYEIREFSFQGVELETAFDIMNDFVAEGHQLNQVLLIEGNNRTLLPVEAFDGQPVTMIMEGLKQEWSAILNQPAYMRSKEYIWLVETIDQQIERCKSGIVLLEMAISHTESTLIKAHKYAGKCSSRIAQIERFTCLLNCYRTQLATQQARLLRLQLHSYQL